MEGYISRNSQYRCLARGMDVYFSVDGDVTRAVAYDVQDGVDHEEAVQHAYVDELSPGERPVDFARVENIAFFEWLIVRVARNRGRTGPDPALHPSVGNWSRGVVVGCETVEPYTPTGCPRIEMDLDQPKAWESI